MQHSFNVNVAKKVGVNSAILLNHFDFWIAKNRADNLNFYDNHYWTFISKKALGDLFPYMTLSQIDYAIKKLIESGYLITGNYNKSTYDRTLWYAITNNGYSILEYSEMELGNFRNGKKNITEPIPYISNNINNNTNNNNTIDNYNYNNKDNNTIINNKDNNTSNNIYSNNNNNNDNNSNVNERQELVKVVNDLVKDEELKDLIVEFIKMRKLMKKPLTEFALKRCINKLSKLSVNISKQKEIVIQSITNGWLDFYELKSTQTKTKNDSFSDYYQFSEEF